MSVNPATGKTEYVDGEGNKFIQGMGTSGGREFDDNEVDKRQEMKKRRKKATTVHEAMDGEVDLDEITALVQGGADINERDGSGHTPLMIASMMGEEGLAETLIYHGCDILAADPQGGTAMHMLATMGEKKHGEIHECLRGGVA